MQTDSWPYNLDGRVFRSLGNTDNGEVDDSTRFYYHQKEDIIWATYEGGQIRFGTLSGYMKPNGELFFHYQHQNLAGEFMTGKCHSIPVPTDRAKLRFQEHWEWTNGDYSQGQSTIEEV